MAMSHPRPEKLEGLVIAQRTLEFTTKDNDNKRALTIRIAAPTVQPDGCCLCCWEIVTPDSVQLRCAAGVDGIRAIALATQMIGVNLEAMALREGYQFRPEDDANERGLFGYSSKLGIPVKPNAHSERKPNGIPG